MEYYEKTLVCVGEDCETLNKEFIVSADAQEFLDSKGWPLPKRCKDCRQKRKNRENSPFKKVADEFKKRHGREKIGDFEGEEKTRHD